MSAAAAGGLLLVLYAMKELFPFGEFTVSWCDMNQQVVPLLCEFKDILEGKGSLFLNLQNAGGMNFWGVFLFFISSPFTFLVAFVEKWQMMRFANILVLLKIMLCAGCASVFLTGFFRNCVRFLPFCYRSAMHFADIPCCFIRIWYGWI